jgi:hypothetical protein
MWEYIGNDDNRRDSSPDANSFLNNVLNKVRLRIDLFDILRITPNAKKVQEPKLSVFYLVPPFTHLLSMGH